MKKLAVLVFCLMLMLALPMVASAEAKDVSPTGVETTKKSTKKTSPKTYDESMVGLAMAVLLISGTTVCVSWKRMRRA